MTQDFRFGRFMLDGRQKMLFKDGAECALRPKSLALLRYLAGRAGQVVGRDEILAAVWPGLYVTEDSITQCIRDIRRALEDNDAHLVRTLPRRGYMLAAAAASPALPAVPSVLVSSAAPSTASLTAVSDTPTTLPSTHAQPQATCVVASTSEATPIPLAGIPLPSAGRPKVLLLPFDNIDGNPDNRYFADGLSDDLVTDLTHFQDLHVATAAAAPPVADGVRPWADYTVAGSVRRAGARVRITVRLSDASSGVCLWAERFDRPLQELFSLQEDLTNHIAASIETRIGRAGLHRLLRHPPANLDAYDLYLQGRDLHGRSNERDMLLARQCFDRSIAADPSYAPAHAWQAYVVQRGFTLGWGEPKGRAALDLALDFGRRAVALEPDSSVCLARLAMVLALAGRHAEAVQTARHAVRANPCDAGSHAAYGEVSSMAGDYATGVAEVQTALSLNPFHPPFWRATLGRSLLLAGRLEEALTELEHARAQAPDYRPCHSSLLVAYVETGRMTQAQAAARDVLRLRPGFRLRDYDGVFGFARDADTERFLRAFRAAGLT